MIGHECLCIAASSLKLSVKKRFTGPKLTFLSESHTILCVSNTSMSINAVFPWCKWPTTATFRTMSGKAVIFNKNLGKGKVNSEYVHSPWPEYIPFVEPSFRHILFLHSPLPHLNWSNNGLSQWLSILLLYQSLHIMTIDFTGAGIILFVFVQNDSLMNRF